MLDTVIYVLCTGLRLFVYFLQTAMFLRALLSWFPASEDSVLSRLLYMVTEPAILPMRALLQKLGSGEDGPLDMSFMLTMLVLIILPYFLPTISL